MKKIKIFICTSCGSVYEPYTCSGKMCRSKKSLDNKCQECHNELKHGIIMNQNIPICGGKKLKINSIDDDSDAYGKSDNNF